MRYWLFSLWLVGLLAVQVYTTQEETGLFASKEKSQRKELSSTHNINDVEVKNIWEGKEKPKLLTNVLLIVHFNHAYYERYMEWIQNMAHFDHMVFTGPTRPLSETGWSREWPAGDPDFFECDDYAVEGLQAYECAARVMRDSRYKDSFDGYLITHFDVGLHPGRLATLPLDKWWQRNTLQWVDDIRKKETLGNWPWWSRPTGVPALMNFWDNFPTVLNETIRNKDFKNKSHWSDNSFADVVYIPRRFAKDFSLWSHHMAKSHIFLELGYSLIRHVLCNPEDYLDILGIRYIDKKLRSDTALLNNSDYVFVHRLIWYEAEVRDQWRLWYQDPSTWYPTPLVADKKKDKKKPKK